VEHVAPKSFVAKCVEAERLPAFADHLIDVIVNLSVETKKCHDSRTGGAGDE
jgi:hypothetical protein